MNSKIKFVSSSYLKNFVFQRTISENERTTIKSMVKRLNPFSNQGTPYTVKIIEFDPNDEIYIERLQKYYNLMKQVQNSHVMKVKETFFVNQNEKYEFWIVMEHCHYESLNKYLVGELLDNYEMKICFISDISIALEYIYEVIGFHHGYLCPENILIQKDLASVFPRVLINNFGLMDPIDGTNGIGIKEYNTNYQPPEYLVEKVHENSDVWSFGMIIFYLVTGKTVNEILGMDYYQLCSSQPEIPFYFIEDKFCLDLLKQMLVYEPEKRIPMNKVFQHQFIKNCVTSKYGTKGDIENYKVVKYLGSGNFGDVSLGENENGDQFAVKEIVYDSKELNKVLSLKREVFIRHCKHPNIIEYKDYCESEKSFIGQIDTSQLPNKTMKEREFIAFVQQRREMTGQFYYLIMEYCDYHFIDLEKYIGHHKETKSGPLSIEEILHFLGDLVGGLHYLHYQRRIAHRDLKPANLMLKSNGEGELPTLKIADYGFARVYTDDMQTSVGTPLYEAPEIYRNQNEKYSSKCDLYSVGVILYYMATFQYPFTDDPQQFPVLMRALVPCELPEDVEIDEDLEDLIYGLVTHHERDRLSWREFFDHPYVQRAISSKLHSSRMEEEDDIEEFMEEEDF